MRSISLCNWHKPWSMVHGYNETESKRNHHKTATIIIITMENFAFLQKDKTTSQWQVKIIIRVREHSPIFLWFRFQDANYWKVPWPLAVISFFSFLSPLPSFPSFIQRFHAPSKGRKRNSVCHFNKSRWEK